MNLPTLEHLKGGPRRTDGKVKDRTLKVEGCGTRIVLAVHVCATCLHHPPNGPARGAFDTTG